MPAAFDEPTQPRRVLVGIGVLASLALLIAFGAQHLFGSEPCPWCVVQRLIVIGIAAIAFSAAAVRGRGSRVACGAGAAGVLLLSGLGALAAWHQHTVAAKQFSCSFTWADRFLMSAGLDRWWPGMFEVRATCADAAQARLLGLPFEWWSGALFVLLGAAAVWTGFGAIRRQPERDRA